MLSGAYGRFLDADKVNWSSARLLGRVGSSGRILKSTNVGRARGVYVLYDDLGIGCAGFCRGNNGLCGRLKNHLTFRHQGQWSRSSWFSFGSPDLDSGPDTEGIHELSLWNGHADTDIDEVIKDLEALLVAAMKPWGNSANRRVQYIETTDWTQVAERSAAVKLFDDIKHLTES